MQSLSLCLLLFMLEKVWFTSLDAAPNSQLLPIHENWVNYPVEELEGGPVGPWTTLEN
jgi:hypothetical protein